MSGGRTIEVEADYDLIPVYVKDGSLIPLAEPVQCVTKDTVFTMHAELFGDKAAEFSLYEDDFETFEYEKNQAKLLLKKKPESELAIIRTGEGPMRYQF